MKESLAFIRARPSLETLATPIDICDHAELNSACSKRIRRKTFDAEIRVALAGHRSPEYSRILLMSSKVSPAACSSSQLLLFFEAYVAESWGRCPPGLDKISVVCILLYSVTGRPAEISVGWVSRKAEIPLKRGHTLSKRSSVGT